MPICKVEHLTYLAFTLRPSAIYSPRFKSLLIQIMTDNFWDYFFCIKWIVLNVVSVKVSDDIWFFARIKIGRSSSVGEATRYGLDDPGIEYRWRRNFPRPTRPALGPTQPPTHWIPALFPGIKRPGRALNHLLTSSAKVKEIVELYLYSPSGPSWSIPG